MEVLVIATKDPRKRYNFVMKPLKLFSNISVRKFQMSSNPIKSIILSLSFSFKNRKIDKVIVCGGDTSGLLWMFLSKIILKCSFIIRLGGDPLKIHKKVILAHAYKGFLIGLKIRLGYIFTRIVLKNVESVIVVNEHLVREVKALVKKDVQIYVVPQFLNNFKKKEENKSKLQNINLLTVTNLFYKEKFKGIKQLISFLLFGVDILTIDRQIQFNILGGGYYEQKLKKFIDTLNIKNDMINIKFHGFRKDTYSFYANADIFIYNSNLDSLPNSVIEAQSYSLPILINSFMPFKYFLKEKRNAIFFKSGDCDSFLKGFKKLIFDEKLLKNMGSNNYYDAINNYSIENVSKKLQNALID